MWTSPPGKYYKVYNDMLSQSHLLIAGATGSGKSVLINGLVYTALFSCPIDRPENKQFILIDPKRVELIDFAALPHTIFYASELDTIVEGLDFAMKTVENRFSVMQGRREKKYSGSDIYIIIDELADLMTTRKKQVEPLLQRLCQVGRAARVHVIAATQCPLTAVIPTTIKVNFDAIVGLHTVTAQHSRNILGRPGCELLPRYGKAYYSTPDGLKKITINMIDSEDMEKRVNYWIKQKKENRR